jgi:hypothetical protein
VHGVDKYDLNFNKDDLEELKAQIERVNQNRFKIQRIIPSRKQTRNPNATAQSIVIFLDDPNAAGECLEGGELRHYSAVPFMPQCQIMQCFNC